VNNPIYFSTSLEKSKTEKPLDIASFIHIGRKHANIEEYKSPGPIIIASFSSITSIALP
jgi:hypothetical protein